MWGSPNDLDILVIAASTARLLDIVGLTVRSGCFRGPSRAPIPLHTPPLLPIPTHLRLEELVLVICVVPARVIYSRPTARVLIAIRTQLDHEASQRHAAYLDWQHIGFNR